jgi:ABC-type Fe3+-hydroxamate transport system substrate-binding protein
MPQVTDQTGRVLEYPQAPKSIISLVPSQTELLFHLGLDEEVVGITKFCVKPEQWFYNKTRVGGTKAVKMDIIRQLDPQLIIANKEENVKEQIEELARFYPVYISDVKNLPQAYEMIAQISLITGKIERGLELVEEIHRRFQRIIPDRTPEKFPRAAYVIWRDPYMVAGGDTFIHDMMKRCGWKNVFENVERYPPVSISQLQDLSPEFLLLSSEPFPFREKHIQELQPLLPKTKIILVDGEMFSWYGSRLLFAPSYFEQLLQSFRPYGTGIM